MAIPWTELWQVGDLPNPGARQNSPTKIMKYQDLFSAKMLPPQSVAKTPLMIEPGGLEGRVWIGASGNEDWRGGVLQSLSKQKQQELWWEFLPLTQMCEYLLLRSQGSGAPVLVYLLFLLHFALLSYHFICFFASNCHQISWFTDLLEGVLS